MQSQRKLVKRKSATKPELKPHAEQPSNTQGHPCKEYRFATLMTTTLADLSEPTTTLTIPRTTRLSPLREIQWAMPRRRIKFLTDQLAGARSTRSKGPSMPSVTQTTFRSARLSASSTKFATSTTTLLIQPMTSMSPLILTPLGPDYFFRPPPPPWRLVTILHHLKKVGSRSAAPGQSCAATSAPMQ